MEIIKTEENFEQFKQRVNVDYKNIKLRLEELRTLYKDNFDDYSYLWLLASLNHAEKALSEACDIMDGWIPTEDPTPFEATEDEIPDEVKEPETDEEAEEDKYFELEEIIEEPIEIHIEDIFKSKTDM